jgi:hypothetical protein
MIELSYEDKVLRMEGDSYPENAMEVFQPLIVKLEDYFSKPGQTLRIDLLIDYLNTSSSKMMTDIISRLQTYHTDGHGIQLNWYYPAGDIDLRETCELFLEDAIFPYTILETAD